jgi:response regulator RpfG family c-di-GMP phosphodiesterase
MTINTPGAFPAYNLPKVLLVDDEPALLDGLRRQLRERYAVTTAVGGRAALDLLGEPGDFAVVVSDMRMPEMDGATLLSLVRQESPDTVRMLLTGQADVESAVAAINDGQIFRFLTKPCAPDTLQTALGDAVSLHNATIAERELLDKTLRGAVQALTDVLALAHPKAFGRAQRIARTVRELAAELHMENRWDVDVAGMVAQLGAVSLPAAVVDKLDRGTPLSPDERSMMARLPAVSAELLASIPRLEGLAQAISRYELPATEEQRYRKDQFDGDPLTLVPQMIRVAVDFDYLTCGRVPVFTALAQLRARGVYSVRVLEALESAYLPGAHGSAPKEMALDDLTPGMILADDVVASDDVLLVGRGTAVTDAMIRRLANYTDRGDFVGRVLIVDERL